MEEAFKVSASLLPTGVAELRFEVAQGYYLYRDRIKISAADADTRLGQSAIAGGRDP